MIDIDIKPMINKLNKYCVSSLEQAAGFCMSHGWIEIEIEHFLLKLLEEQNADAQIIIKHFGVNENRLHKILLQSIEREKTGTSQKPVFSRLLLEWIQDAWVLSSVENNIGDVRSGMLLLALIANPRRYGLNEFYDELGDIKADELRRDIMDIVSSSIEVSHQQTTLNPSQSIPGQPVTNTALQKYTVAFTEKARNGELDPVFCRDVEIRQMIDILARRRKNNPILVGDAGVGKTAVVEGLALRIVEDKVPETLKGTEIYGLDLGLLQAGASVKGEFESRLKSVLQEIKSSETPIILFIDEAHTLIGAGGSAGTNDAANLLKPELARGELRTIAATTWSEYKKYFEKDPALARRFQLVKLGEPSPEEAVTIMRGLRDKYEAAHGVYIRDDAVVASAELAARYISGRQLPDKSVDLLDTSCARVKIKLSSAPSKVEDLYQDIQVLQREMDAIQRDIDMGSHAQHDKVDEIKTKIAEKTKQHARLSKAWKKEQLAVDIVIKLRKQLRNMKVENNDESKVDEGEHNISIKELRSQLINAETNLKDIQGDSPLIHFEVTPDAVSEVVADWTGIPVGSMVKDEAKAILKFTSELNKRIIGQDHAIAAIDQRVKTSKAGIGSPDAPTAVMLFVGPSGVGKTETSLGIAELLFGGERFTISINMSEFQEKHSVSRLIGSPPGYVGYGEGGLLTEAVRQRPYSVVLLDEVEKADPEVMNIFYQVFDKGVLTDGEGREVDFKNTVIIMTSNLGSEIISQACGNGELPAVDDLVDVMRPVLSQHFKPALLARMEIVPFYPIGDGAMDEIVKIKINQLAKRLKENQNMQLNYDNSVIEQITKRCTEVEMGARNIDLIISKNLMPNISTEILKMMSTDSLPTNLNIGIDKKGEFKIEFSTD